jgi:enoyl-CoA hydratase/carnithine racemase
VFNRLESLPKPTVAVIRGYALGGGLELALACDFRLAYPDAWFANPEVQRGWLPGWGGMWRLPRLLGEARAKELILLSERIDAQEALRLGLVTRLVSFGEGPETVRAFAGKLGSLRPEIFALAKTSLTGSAGSLRDRAIQFDVLAALYAKNLAG